MENLTLEQKIGQLVVIGFYGIDPDAATVRGMLAQARNGTIGGVILFGYNIKGPAQLKRLMKAIHQEPKTYPLFTIVDQEGGRVQRLDPEKGFSGFHSAKTVAENLTPSAAREQYADMGAMLKRYGFNFDFAPCVDLDTTPPCSVIGGLERSYGCQPARVADYALALMDGLHEHGILTCLKHYPGHGRAQGDSHIGPVDITDTWSEASLEPYAALVKTGRVDAVMTAHLLHQGMDPDTPATFSEKWIGRLRNEMGFDGVVVPDDLNMGAILHHYSLEEIVIRGLNAGLDLLLFSNNPLAANAQGIRQDARSTGFGNSRVPDAALPGKIIRIAVDAVASGAISETRINEAVSRVMALKQRLQVSKT